MISSGIVRIFSVLGSMKPSAGPSGSPVWTTNPSAAAYPSKYKQIFQMKNKIQACLDFPHKSRQEGCIPVKMNIHYLQAGSKVFWISIRVKKLKMISLVMSFLILHIHITQENRQPSILPISFLKFRSASKPIEVSQIYYSN